MAVRLRQSVLLVCVVAGIVVSAAGRAAENESLDKLRADKLAAAKERYEFVEPGWIAGVNPASELYAASRDWKDAEIEVAKSKRERLQALQSHLERMETLYKKIHALAADNKRGGEADKNAAAHFWAVQAKIWLLEEKSKP